MKYGGLLGTFAAPSVGQMARSLNVGAGSQTLEKLGQELLGRTDADLLVGIQVEQESAGSDGVTVKFDARLCVLGAGDGTRSVRSTQSWKTASSEVGRLVGLVALNLVRRYLGQFSDTKR